MKIAVIVVGSHLSGKSKTIKKYLKPMLGISPYARLFVLNGKKGVVLSQSFEESGRDFDEALIRYADRELFVVAARPENERASRLHEIEAAFSKRKFNHSRIHVVANQAASYYESCARNIVKRLDA